MRPAEYDLVPDIRCDPVSIIINLVIGLALSAASMLLAPKPTTQSQRQIRQKQLSSQVGPSRFNQTSSFDGYSALVEYGVPVPIPFGRVGTGADGRLSGGLVLVAMLVWSRAFSMGGHQRVKMLFTTGEWILSRPTLRGVWIGTTALSSLATLDFAWYWRSAGGNNRIYGDHLIAGTRATPSAGDPEPQNEVCIAPVDGTIEGPGFCMVYNPTTKSTFGQFNPVRNGTAHRVNWEVVSIPFQLEEQKDGEDAIRRERARRIKISGEMAGRVGIGNSKVGGQPGVGRAYSSQLGVIAHNGVGINEKQPSVYVQPGDTLTFRIGSHTFTSLNNDNYFWSDFMAESPKKWGVKHKDIREAINQHRERADSLFVPGSRWMIGSTQWVVESRTSDIWKPKTEVDVILKCVSTSGSNQIGIPGLRAVTEPLAGYEGPWDTEMGGPRPDYISPEGFNTRKHCGAAFWNLVQYEVASIRMVRPCDTIEFGIRSTVWNRANNLCNFNSLLSPGQLVARDRNDVNVTAGTVNRYFKRTSCFSVWVRPLPDYTPSGGTLPEWSRINQVFCVTGQSPEPMYNYLRIRPRVQGRYEFRFIPRVGSDIAINSWEGAIFWRLNAQSGVVHGQDFETAYGAFRVTMTGDLVTREAVLINDELVTDPGDLVTSVGTKVVPTAVFDYAWSGTPYTGQWYKNTYLTELLGPPSYAGEVRSAVFTHFKPRGPGADDDGYIQIRVWATANNNSGPQHASYFGTSLNWAGDGSTYRFEVVQGTGTRGQWAMGDQFTHTVNISGGNRYSIMGYTQMSVAFQVSNVSTIQVEDTVVNFDKDERYFELYSQVSDCSHYDELEKSCASSPEHEIVYVNEAVSEGEGRTPEYTDLAMTCLTVKSSQSLNSIEQLRLWVDNGIEVERLTEGGRGASNLFSDFLYYLLTNKTQGLGETVPPDLIDRQSFADTGRYLATNHIYWNGVLEAEENIRSFASTYATNSLCIFTIKNGVFGLMPGLPVDSAGNISTAPIPIQQIFTAGNIVEESLQVTYTEGDARTPTSYSVRWRVMRPYELPDEATAIVSIKSEPSRTIEDLDLTDFCDNREQALRTARYLLATRRYTDHAVSFKTTPEVTNIEPGSYIRVIANEVDYREGRAFRIADDLSIVSPEPMADGTYTAAVYLPGATDVVEQTVEIRAGSAVDPQLRGAIAAVYDLTPHNGVYQVQEVTLDEDLLVTVRAVTVPTESNGSSKLADIVLNGTGFEVRE